jgi:hypothetical protein
LGTSSITAPILKLSPVLNPDDEMQRSTNEKETTELNLALEAAPKAGTEEAHVEKECKQLKMQHNEQMSSLRLMALDKAQLRIRQ